MSSVEFKHNYHVSHPLYIGSVRDEVAEHSIKKCAHRRLKDYSKCEAWQEVSYSLRKQ